MYIVTTVNHKNHLLCAPQNDVKTTFIHFVKYFQGNFHNMLKNDTVPCKDFQNLLIKR